MRQISENTVQNAENAENWPKKTENIENLSRNIGPKRHKILKTVKRKTENTVNLPRNIGQKCRKYQKILGTLSRNSVKIFDQIRHPTFIQSRSSIFFCRWKKKYSFFIHSIDFPPKCVQSELLQVKKIQYLSQNIPLNILKIFKNF